MGLRKGEEEPCYRTTRISNARDVTPGEREPVMNPESNRVNEDDLRTEYDIRGAVRGKYYKQYMEGTNVVLLDPDVAAIFRDAKAVNQALRVLMNAASQIEQRPKAGST